ncbi:MAG: Gfo/Idh/MocA family oxidoreductase [Thermomicrobiales bacterium]
MTVRFGVVGLRRGASFVRVCSAATGATVSALYDINAEAVGTAAAEIGARPFSDYEAFLNSDIDAVVIASPLAFHAGQAAQALRAGKHVLSEVTACLDLAQAAELVAAARESSAVYMMAENYRYLDEVELLKRLADDGRFGDLYFLEGEYLHDCKDLWFDRDGNLTWRGRGELGVYCTHSLGPLLYITGERVDTVSCVEVPGGKFREDIQNPTMHLMQMVTDKGTVFRVRVDHVSPRPHQMAYYSVQGARGSFESWRGHGDTSKLWLEDEHEPSRVSGEGAQWHATGPYAERYIPERLAVPAEASFGGHGTSEYWMLRDFLAAVKGDISSPIDVDRAMDYTLPGIVALESARTAGTPIAVPDSRLFS